ncbi:Cyclin, N-terminal domain containing protein [Histomonas meleagridis]|uniref:Cyclin, N-terminal domain containing protein n=1 Tax=Histomonas meleagridis TaxID=135588 RepID=UPI003559F7EC|nr:Cyclin, N-terminal domain containing protein [Histomonas meleagridis]KAH0804834.1 Cyclin, N-terminal domain containing protein [Histomonas meleagridis]
MHPIPTRIAVAARNAREMRSTRKALGDVKSKHNSISLNPHDKTFIVPKQKPKQKISEERLGKIEDPQDAFEYDLEVYHFLIEHENEKLPSPVIFLNQTNIKPRMRSIVIDWLIGVHNHLEMHTDTLFSAIEIADLYLSKVDIHRSKLQLLYTTALFISAKNQEVTLPTIDDFVYFTKNSFTSDDVIKMEMNILNEIDFFVNPIHSSIFMKRYLRLCDPSNEISMMAHYLNETLLLDESFIGMCPSKRAASVVCLSLTLERGNNQWNQYLVTNTGYKTTDLQPIVNKILTSVKKIKSSKLNTLEKKYAHSRLCSVSLKSLPISLSVE